MDLLDNPEESKRKRKLFEGSIYDMAKSIDKNLSSLCEANENLEKDKINELNLRKYLLLI
jgi:hypothetical protein